MSTNVISTEALIAKFQQALDEKWGYIWGTAGESWTAVKQAQLENTTDKNRAMSRKYGKKWIGHKVSDCSGLFLWAFKQFGMSMSHISSNIYKSYCTSTKGRLTAELKQTIRAGSAVFTGDAPGNHPHVGLYIGNDTVIEAKGTVNGVVTSKLTDKKWTFYGELKSVDYGEPQQISEPAPIPEPMLPTLRKGSKGEYVQLLQTKLMMLGYDLGSYGVDGDFGTKTQAAVKAFQKDRGLSADGVVGAKTWEELEKPAEAAMYTVTITGLTAAKADEIVGKYGGTKQKQSI